jgi:putative transposase
MMQKAKLDGKAWNHKRVHRIYCELGLNIRVKPRKRIPKGEAKMLFQPLKPNHCWSIDFMSDALWNGMKFRTFNMIDDYNRSALLVEPDYNLPAQRVTQLIDQVAQRRGYPDMIRSDHGPEFESNHFQSWARSHHILLQPIQPGKPAQNGFIERFNRTYREEVLDMNFFSSLEEVKQITANWMHEYNEERPHESLAGLPPAQFAKDRAKHLAGMKGKTSPFDLF